jgi:hypothetical protein
MYQKLFNRITDVINELQTVQAETEEMFILNEPEQGIFQTSPGDKGTEQS